MATLNIDEKLYDLDKINPEAKAKVDSARYCERKIAELEAELAVVRTARLAYLQALPELLNKDALIKDNKQPVKKPVARKPKATTRKTKTATSH